MQRPNAFTHVDGHHKKKQNTHYLAPSCDKPKSLSLQRYIWGNSILCGQPRRQTPSGIDRKTAAAILNGMRSASERCHLKTTKTTIKGLSCGKVVEGVYNRVWTHIVGFSRMHPLTLHVDRNTEIPGRREVDCSRKYFQQMRLWSNRRFIATQSVKEK